MQNKKWLMVAVALLMTWLLLSWLIASALLQPRFADLLQRESLSQQHQADSLASDMANRLSHLHGIPVLVALSPSVPRAVLRLQAQAPVPAALRRQVWTRTDFLRDLDHQFSDQAKATGLDVVWLLNARGDCIAASNAGHAISFVGVNYADRDYFRMAVAGKPGYQYAVGRKSNIPGLYFSAPVSAAGRVVGVLVVKVNLQQLAYWTNQPDTFISDNYGVVVMAHDPALLMHALPHGGIGQLDSAQRLSRYKRTSFPALQIRSWGDARYPQLLRFSGVATPVLMAQRSVSQDRVSIYALDRLNGFAAIRQQNMIFFLLLAASGWIVMLIVANRWSAARMRTLAAQEMKKSLSLLRATLESTSDGILVVDQSGLVSTCNQHFIDLWRIPSDKDLLREEARLLDFVAAQLEHADDFRLRIAEIQRNPEQISHDVLLLSDGRIFERDSFPQYLGNEVVGLVWNFRDITARKRAEEQVSQSNQEKYQILESTGEGIYGIDTRGYCTFANSAASQILGYSVEEMLGKDMHVLIHHHHHNGAPYLIHECKIYHAFRTGQYIKNDSEVFWRKDNSAVEVEYLSSPIVNDGVIVGAVVTFSDISRRKQDEAELRIAAISFESQEGISVTDESGLFLRVNRAFTRITGYSAQDVIGKHPRLLKSGRHDAAFYAQMWESIQRNGVWDGEIWNRRKNGEIYPEHLTISAVRNASGVVSNYVATLTDITLTKAAEDEIKYLAFYDPLTRQPNRRLLLDRLKQALVSCARNHCSGALLFIDLDDFKTLNDTLGHDMGDLLLQQVAKRLESCVRMGDTVARFGGDEFVVMLEGLSQEPLAAAEQAEAVGDKILLVLNQPYQLGNYEHHNTPSIGVTLFDNDRQTTDELLKQADIAMYQSKKAGHNTLHFFDPVMQETVNARALLENELRNAIELEQFHLYYQIQVDENHLVLGAEALIRWIHPQRGLVSPADFIPLAEESGLILPIGKWVLDTACAKIKSWQQGTVSKNLVLAVNVSAKQFRQADFVLQVKEAIERHGINPRLLKLELTESLLLNDIEETIVTMKALNGIGVNFSLDDFGTGYSSLQYLKRLPLHQIKIDQSFVRDIVTDHSDKAIVRTIIAIARSLNLNVIAEGVESESQLQLLMEMGCTHYQGFLFGRPVPLAQFETELHWTRSERRGRRKR